MEDFENNTNWSSLAYSSADLMNLMNPTIHFEYEFFGLLLTYIAGK